MTMNSLVVVFSTKLIPFIYALVGFGLLITIHEFGHFIFCKVFKIHTPTFSIGMGPKIFERKIGQTNFRLSAIPIGGYVEIAGLSEVGQGEQGHANLKGEESFAKKPYWQKFFVLCGGVLFNLLFAYIVYSALFFVGIPKTSMRIFISEKKDFASLTKNFNMQPGDEIIAINNKALGTEGTSVILNIKKELVGPLKKGRETPISIQVKRNNETVDLSLDISNKENNLKLLQLLTPKTDVIPGKFEKYSFFKAIVKGIDATNNIIKQMVLAIIYLIKEKSLSGAGGPIMILSKTFETAQKGIIPLLLFLAFISINLAIINILPLGALDGGQLLFVSIEAIIRREIPAIIKNSINIASWIALISLILYLGYKDILNIFIK